MNRSQRLINANSNLILLALTVGSLLNTLRTMGLGAPAPVLIVIALCFATIGTIGWALCQRGGTYWIYIYFVVQFGLLIGFSIIEVQTTHNITTNVPWAVPILFQGAALGRRKQSALAVVIFIGHLIIHLLLISPLAVIPAAIFYALLLRVVVYFSDLMEREEEARAMLEEANRKLTEYARQAEELAAAKERNRLAREIHDSLGHYLTAVNMQIEAAMAVMSSDGPLAIRSLERAQNLTKEGLTEIRRSVASLRAAPTVSRPLHEAIMTLVEENQAAGLTMGYQVDGTIRPCSAQLEMALYRIAQEGLTNIRKHAKASQANLTLNYSNPQAVELQIQDNGVGAEQTDNGFGLLGIRERVELLGGNLTMRTVPGQGFTLQVELPG